MGHIEPAQKSSKKEKKFVSIADTVQVHTESRFLFTLSSILCLHNKGKRVMKLDRIKYATHPLHRDQMDVNEQLSAGAI